MTKPIEWTTTENMPVIFWHRMHVDESGELRDATPSDLASALAAMGEGEREEVLRASGAAASFDMQTAIITDLRTRLKEATRLHSEAESSLDLERTLRRADARFADAKLNESIARAEKAERERDEARAEVLAAFHGDSIVHRHLQERVEDAERERDRMAREFGTRPGELPDDGEIERVVRERAEFRARAEKAERERDEARAEQERLLQSNARYPRAADEAIRDRDMALGERSRAQAERDTERACRLENEAELHRANKELGDLRTRLIAALKAERDDARLRCGAALATAATATARADTAAASHLASAGLVAEFRGRLAAAESALDVAQSRAVRAEKLADEALADRDRARASLDIVRHDLEGTRRDLGDLRSRLIAAETAAAQREPREYPLAVGSEWEGDRVVSRWDSAIAEIIAAPDRASVQLLKLQWGPWQIGIDLADVLALAHRRGML